MEQCSHMPLLLASSLLAARGSLRESLHPLPLQTIRDSRLNLARAASPLKKVLCRTFEKPRTHTWHLMAALMGIAAAAIHALCYLPSSLCNLPSSRQPFYTALHMPQSVASRLQSMLGSARGCRPHLHGWFLRWFRL